MRDRQYKAMDQGRRRGVGPSLAFGEGEDQGQVGKAMDQGRRRGDGPRVVGAWRWTKGVGQIGNMDQGR